MLQATETALSLAVREEIGAVMSDRRPAYVAGAGGAVRFANAAGILSAGAETFLDIAGRPLPFDPAVCRHVARFAAHAEAGRRSTELVRYRKGMTADLVQVTLIALGETGGERLVLVILATPLRGAQAIDFAASLRLLREPGLLLAAFDERGDVCAAVGDYAILQHTQDAVEDFVAATDAAPVRRAVVGTDARVRVTIVTVGATDLRILAVERDEAAADEAAAVAAEPGPGAEGEAATDGPEAGATAVADARSAASAVSTEAAASVEDAVSAQDAPPEEAVAFGDVAPPVERALHLEDQAPAEDTAEDAAPFADAATAVLAALAPALPAEPPAPPYPGFDASDTERAIDLVAEAGAAAVAGSVETENVATGAASDAVAATQADGSEPDVPVTPGTEAASPRDEAPGFTFAAEPRPRRIMWQTDAAGNLTFLSADFAAALGAGVAPRLGESWAAAAARLGVDAADYVAAAFARQAQFAGLVLEWPVAGHALGVPVELTGLPVYGSGRRFDGFRGFGLVRTGDAKATRTLVAPPEPPPPAETLASEPLASPEPPASPEPLPTPEPPASPELSGPTEALTPTGPLTTLAETADRPDGDAAPAADTVAEPDVGPSVTVAVPIDASAGDPGSAPSASAASDEIQADPPEVAVSDEPEAQVAPDDGVAIASPGAGQTAAGGEASPRPEPDAGGGAAGAMAAAVPASPVAEDTAIDVEAASPDAEPIAGEPDAEATPIVARPSGRPSLTIVESEAQPDHGTAEASPPTVPSPDAASPPDAAHPAPAGSDEAGSGRVVPVPAKADARVVTLASALRRPADGRLTPPERIAFRQIAQALGARLEGDEPARKPPAPPTGRDPATAKGGADEKSAAPVLSGERTRDAAPDDREGERADARDHDTTAPPHGDDGAPLAMDVVWADWVAEQDAATLKAAPDTHPQKGGASEPTARQPADALTGAAHPSLPVGLAEAKSPPASVLEAPGSPELELPAPPAAARAASALPTDEAEAKPRVGLADPVVVSDAAERILARLPIGAAVVKDETLLFVNPAFLRLLGYASAEELQQAGGLGALFAGPHAGRNFETGADAKPVPAVAKDGSVVPVTARIVVIPWGAGSALLLTLDRAQRALESETISGRAALDALGAARERADELEAVIDTATDGVLMLDGDGRVVSANRASEALFGQDRSEMTGRPFLALLAPESHRSAQDYLDGLARNGVASVLNDGREVIGQVRPDGLIPLFMTIGRISSGRSSRFCAVLRDITQWKKSEEELTAARRRAEEASVHKSEFLAKISHEIRTPLNAVIGFSEVMLDERFGPIGNERYKDYLRDIRTSGAHIMSLINDLLDLSKVEAGKMDLKFEAVALADLLGECVAMMQPQANRERIIIRASLPVSVPAVVADPRSIRQIVLNLLSNAVKFTPAGGQVIVSTALEDTGEVVVRVRDTGYGMTEKEIQTALEPFRQLHTARTRAGGTGLGLPLTKALVEANRAAFRIDSTVNQGTLVSVTFPVTRVLAG
jgi:PAS domain S-box-containing protein